jgi:hypothetical protein
MVGTANLQRRYGVAPEIREKRGSIQNMNTFRGHCPTVLGLKIPVVGYDAI